MTEEDQIDPLSPVPRYRQVAGLIRARIESGELQPGEPIPSQNQIIQRYGIARQTAHNALRLLVDEGLVVIVPGVGALVARRLEVREKSGLLPDPARSNPSQPDVR